jgi:glycosyltransferase involved in cell wall biosynthesis
LGVGPEAFLVLTVGRLTEQKGHRYLLAAVPTVLECFPETCFRVVGEGPQWGALNHQAEELGVVDRVRFMGTRHDLQDLYLAADVFVLPSVSEGMPMVLLEAMGSGLPVIASGLGGIQAVVMDGENGLLVPPAEVESLALAINRLLADEVLRERLSRNGKVLIHEEYTVDRMCERYARVFQLEQYQEGKG